MDFNYPEGYLMTLFQWDEKKTSTKLQLSEERLSVIASDGSGFKSSIGDYEFSVGYKYYFELKVIKGSLIKIGVCTEKAHYEDQAFSDSEEGWAMYNGELRHNSNSQGKKYGILYKAGDLIGVYLDMIEVESMSYDFYHQGSLAFSINGQHQGIAFEEPRFKNTGLFAAIAPIYKDDSICLNMVLRED